MSLEAGSFVSDLNQSNPPGTDKKKQGDDHLRLIKAVLRGTFPNADRAVRFARSRATTTSDAIAATDMNALVVANAVGSSQSHSLPSLTAGDDGWSTTVMKTDASANTVTLSGTINGATDMILTRQFEGALVQWTGTAWVAVRLRPFITTGDMVANAVTDAILRDSAGLSVIGRSANSSGDPADIVAGSDGLVLLRNGAVLQFGQVATAGLLDANVTPAKLSLEAGSFIKGLYHIRDEKGSGTDGDALTSGSWSTRTLQTEKQDDLTVTTSANVISLAAGTYWAEVFATTQFTGSASQGGVQHCMSKLRLRNTTDGTTLVHGVGGRWQGQDDGGGNIQLMDICIQTSISDRFTIAGTKSIELQNYTINQLISTPLIKGGKAISSGENEVYADVRLYKIG